MTVLMNLDAEQLTILMSVIATYGDKEGLWKEDDGLEKCLATLTLPKGLVEAAQSYFTNKVCKSCTTQDCDEKDNIVNELLGAIFLLGMKTILDIRARNVHM